MDESAATANDESSTDRGRAGESNPFPVGEIPSEVWGIDSEGNDRSTRHNLRPRSQAWNTGTLGLRSNCLQGDAPDAQYVFNFGEGPATLPGGPETTHRFEQDGDYEVGVKATLADRQAQSE